MEWIIAIVGILLLLELISCQTYYSLVWLFHSYRLNMGLGFILCLGLFLVGSLDVFAFEYDGTAAQYRFIVMCQSVSRFEDISYV